MWLLEVETFNLQFFAVPPARYAILSHTWGDDEVLFQDMQDVCQARDKAGWRKIQFVCDEAKRNNLPYAWLDSCCIDKSSSAELSEAINSMFEWYQRAECCYTYLSDLGELWKASSRVTKEQLAECRWFTRGWTLQELIASPSMVFFDREWTVIGTKDSLTPELAEITGIDEPVLQVMDFMFGLPVGRRMSWAAKRKTTRVEDLAYCLLGIFGVNMPLLYGEGEKAFLRLQEEILTRHHDLSLFAWRQAKSSPAFRGIFAQAPAEFVDCSSIISRINPFFSGVKFSVASQGLMVDLDSHVASAQQDMISLDLGCLETSKDPLPKRIAVSLKKFGDYYIRASPYKLALSVTPPYGSAYDDTSKQEGMPQGICVKKTLLQSHADFVQLVCQRRLVLLYRTDLTRSMGQFNLASGPPPRPGLPLNDLKGIFHVNDVEDSDLGFFQCFNVGYGGSDPIWWDSFTLSHSDGGEYSFAVMCGIPIKPDAPSEYLLPWFAIFCDRDADTSKSRLAVMLLSCARVNASSDMMRQVTDIIFQLYTDHSGNIIQQRLPTSCDFGNKRRGLHRLSVNRLGGGGSLFCADVQWQRID